MPVWIATLALHCADLISIVFIGAMADRIRLILCYHSGVHFAEVEVNHLNVASDDGDEHLPFLRECSQGNHGLELRRDFNICSLHTRKHTKHLIEVDVGVSYCRYACSEAVLKVFKDCGHCCFSIGGFQSVPERKGGVESGVVLLNHGQQPKHDLPQHYQQNFLPETWAGRPHIVTCDWEIEYILCMCTGRQNTFYACDQ
jgi:hypothetical protein